MHAVCCGAGLFPARPSRREAAPFVKSYSCSTTVFCATPLAHERATVLDAHFDNITTEVIQTHKRYYSMRFMEHLRREAKLA